MIAAALLFSKQIAAIDRKAKAKDTGVLNEAKRNENGWTLTQRVAVYRTGLADVPAVFVRLLGKLDNVE